MYILFQIFDIPTPQFSLLKIINFGHHQHYYY